MLTTQARWEPLSLAAEKDKLLEEYRRFAKDPELFPERLLRRCAEWGVAPNALRVQAPYDRLLVAHIMPFGFEYREGQWYHKGGAIAIPERTYERLKDTAPRVLIVNAGLGALEQLHSHGMDIGHYATILRLSPYRVPVDIDSSGRAHYLTATRAADLVLSEDTMRLLAGGVDDDGTETPPKLRRRWVHRGGASGYVYEVIEGFENDPDVRAFADPSKQRAHDAPSFEDM